MDQELNEALAGGFMVPSLPRIDSASESGDLEDAPSDSDAEDAGYKLRPTRRSTDLEHAYDLSPPPPTNTDRRAEDIAERLFSVEHLNVLLKDNGHLQRFTTFLMRYRAHCVPTLVRYLDSQKALKAIQYANVLADQITQQPSWPTKANAASLDPRFERLSQRALDDLVAEALPAYVTFNVVDVVTELLNKEIVGRNTPVMRELVHGLAEVYCLSDPSQEGNPIVFASEEFYSATQYGSGYAIGKSCRFLHGPKTDKRAIERLDKAVQAQQDVVETMVQYRQDGTPFLALVMISPLKDNKGVVRYFIGARIDVTHLVDGGKTMDSFHQLLTGDRPATPVVDPLENRPTLKALRDFGDLLNDEERGSLKDSELTRTESRPTTPRLAQSPSQRRFVGIEERISQDGLRSHYSGQAPGVYQNYMLVRPYPSLRIIFTSPSLRIPGLCQSKLEDHIGGPEHVRDSLIDALSQGIGVTAKVSWLTRTSRPSTRLEVLQLSDDASIATNDDAIEGKARWIHCTPLTGSDGNVGVIMILMVDKEEHILSNLSNLSSLRSSGQGVIGPVPPRAQERARSHTSLRSEYTPDRSTPRDRSSPSSVVKERPSTERLRHDATRHSIETSRPRPSAAAAAGLARGGTINTPPARSMGGSRLYADWMKEIREAQKRADPFSTRSREHEAHDSGLGSMARAVEVKAVSGKAVSGKAQTKRIGGTF